MENQTRKSESKSLEHVIKSIVLDCSTLQTQKDKVSKQNSTNNISTSKKDNDSILQHQEKAAKAKMVKNHNISS